MYESIVCKMPTRVNDWQHVEANFLQEQQNHSNHLNLIDYKQYTSRTTRLRVSKWDAGILDMEILELLKAPMKNMFAFFQPGTFDQWRPEMDFLLHFLLFLFSTGLYRPTPGMKLQNIQFTKRSLTSPRVPFFFLLGVVMPYGWKRLNRYLTANSRHVSSTSTVQGEVTQERRMKLIQWLKKMETFMIACQFFNLIVFLREGTYRFVSERLLGMKLEKIKPLMEPRHINFEYMNRQLLWDGLMEFGSFVLPFLTWSRWHASKRFHENNEEPFAGSFRTVSCSYCGIQPPQTPYITSCKHIYCYYCLQTAVAADEEFVCVSCGVKFDSSQRLRS